MLNIRGKIRLATTRLTGNSSVSKTDSTSALMTVTEDKKGDLFPLF